MTWLLLWLPFYDDPEKSKRLKAEELDHIRSDGAPEAAGACGSCPSSIYATMMSIEEELRRRVPERPTNLSRTVRSSL